MDCIWWKWMKHSGAERSLSQKKYIIDKTYTVWKVWAISFRNSWRKNPDLAAFWEKRKNVIFLVSELENEGFIRISLEFWLELLTIDYKLMLTFMFDLKILDFFNFFVFFKVYFDHVADCIFVWKFFTIFFGPRRINKKIWSRSDDFLASKFLSNVPLMPQDWLVPF